jgi:predicted RNase H-like HicB family nuclease
LDRPVERIEAELFTDGSNNAVVRLPGRGFPGVLIQGDTLANLRADLAVAQEACTRGDIEEARESVAFVLQDLDGLLERYVKALEAHGMPLPLHRAS